MLRWLIGGALFASGCAPTLGPCDTGAALELVYTADGIPSFAGQAIVSTSCGNGAFCHAGPQIPPEDRFGVPVGLAFDVRLASTTRDTWAEQTERLRDDLLRVLRMRGDVLREVEHGHLPLQGGAGATYRCQILPSTCGSGGQDLAYDRFGDDGITSTPLPTLLDPDPARRDEAEEIVRNWLSCLTPAVERTIARIDRGPNLVGFTVAACERSCVDVRWPEIYARIIEPTCATSRCHDDSDPASGLDMLTGGADGIHARLVADGQRADGPYCGSTGLTLIVASVPDASLLLQKVEATTAADVCGDVMPPGARLGAQRLCVLRAWIACGACPEEDGGACAACLDAAREDCNVDVAATLGCRSSASCPNRATLDRP